MGFTPVGQADRLIDHPLKNQVDGRRGLVGREYAMVHNNATVHRLPYFLYPMADT